MTGIGVVTLAVLVAEAVVIAWLLVREIGLRRRGDARSEALIALAHERCAHAIAAFGVGIWDWRLDSDEIYLDPALKRMLGYDDSEMPDRIDAWRACIHPKDRVRSLAVLHECLDASSDSYVIVQRMIDKNGSVRWFESRALVIRDAVGQPTRLVGADRDVTDSRGLAGAFRSDTFARAGNAARDIPA
jgi:PAS domain S-box-containing protein